MKLLDIIESDLIKTIDENGKRKFALNDLELHSDSEKRDVYIFWHKPSINLSFYPILQVNDDEGNTVLWGEADENKESWMKWLKEKLKDYTESDDWWYIK